MAAGTRTNNVQTTLASSDNARVVGQRQVDVANPEAATLAIVRAGVQVNPPPLDTAMAEAFAKSLNTISRTAVPRVLSQSVPANTRVSVGTNIDLVLVPVDSIGLNLFQGMDQALIGKSVKDLLTVVSQPGVSGILAKTSDPTTLSDADKATIKGAYQTIGVQIAPNGDFSSALSSMQGVLAFQ
jgi:hypothetical protein